jgi:glycosyltransferase involved in cell wall biosynthesis
MRAGAAVVQTLDARAPEVERPLRVLTFTNLYPNAAQPRHGLFVADRVRYLRASGRVETTVVAPVPWFPFSAERFGRYGTYARVPAREERDGVTVHHPRYLAIPKVGMSAAPWLMAAGARECVARLADRIDLIDAHYFYPDGVAAVALGRRLRKPVVVTAHGTDLNVVPEHALPRRFIRDAARDAAGLVTVSEALRERLVGLGVERERVSIVHNAVDLARFVPADRAAARARLALGGRVLLAVGNLVPEKGHALALAAVAALPDTTLVVAGDGPLRAALELQARRLGIEARVRFLGGVPQAALVEYYNAADLLVLTSSREGMPNVVLEALACGTPVVATRVGGVPEVIDCEAAGRLVDGATAEDVAAAVRALLEAPPQRADTRRVAERFGWEATTRGQIELFTRVARAARREGA